MRPKAPRAASAADRATVALTVTGSVANTYFQLLSLRERIAVTEANIRASASRPSMWCSGG